MASLMFCLREWSMCTGKDCVFNCREECFIDSLLALLCVEVFYFPFDLLPGYSFYHWKLGGSLQLLLLRGVFLPPVLPVFAFCIWRFFCGWSRAGGALCYCAWGRATHMWVGAGCRKAAPDFSAALTWNWASVTWDLRTRNAGRPAPSSEIAYFLTGSIGREAVSTPSSLWASGKGELLGQRKECIVAEIPQLLPFLRFSL